MNLLADLNDEQQKAVTHKSGPALVVAGAGTGKTTVITRRIAWLVEQGLAKPDEILALTFTDKAAGEMEERVDVLLPMGYINTQVMTFHALGDQILRDHGLEIGLSPDFLLMSHFAQVVFLRELIRGQKLDHFAPLGSPFRFIDALLGHFSRLKDEAITPDHYDDFVNQKRQDKGIEPTELNKLAEQATLYRLYVERARAESRLDFGDQISLCIELLMARPAIAQQYRSKFKYILVDEYQDTNNAQSKLLSLLINKQQNIMVVGDDDQSIYRFRGASIDNILEFRTQYPRSKQIVLSHNYRSTQPILDLAYRLIQANNPDRLEVKNKINKQLLGNKTGIKPVYRNFDNINQEHDWIADNIKSDLESGVAPKDIAVLVRRNSQIKNIIHTLHRHGIKTVSSAPENLLQKPEIRSLISFIDFMVSPDNQGALYRCLIGEFHQLSVQMIQPVMSQAKRSHTALEENITDDSIRSELDTLASYRGYINELSTGQLVFKYIQESGHLDDLIKKAQADNASAQKVQNIAKFFRFIKDFESVSDDPSVMSFSNYMSEVDDSGSELTTVESPLDNDAVWVLTVHRAKGLEYHSVYIAEMADQIFPSRRQADQLPLPDGLVEIKTAGDWHRQEERRLFYVALTRAKSKLVLSSSLDYGKARLRKVSPFVFEAFGDVSIKDKKTSALGVEHIDSFSPKPILDVNLASHLFHDGWLHLSTQQVDDYLRDPTQFWVTHLLNMPKGPFHALVYGSAIHNAIEVYNRAKIQHQPIELSAMYEAFEQTWRSEGFVSRDHEQARKARARQVLKRFFDQHETDQDWPKLVEEPFTLTLEAQKIRINGRFDAVFDRAGQIEIRDYKTSEVSSETAAKRRLSGNIQLGIYALAWERIQQAPVTILSLDFVDSGYLVSTNRINHNKIIEKIEKVAAGIRNNQFFSDDFDVNSFLGQV